MKNYSKIYQPAQTPQSAPIPGSNQVQNNAGGYGWQITDWQQLDRFLVLGVCTNTYYEGENELTLKTAEAVRRCITADGVRTVNRIVEVSDQGLAPKNDPALFALAMCASFGNEATKQAAFKALPKVARIGTHLFTFVEYTNNLRGWGRGLRRAVANWYLEKPVDKLAYQMVKYRQRNGWSHRDLLRLAHPKTEESQKNRLFKWAVSGEWTLQTDNDPSSLVDGFTLIQLHDTEKQSDKSVEVAATLIKNYHLPREAVPTSLLKRMEIWQALLDDNMPLGALIRNLGNLAKVGLMLPGKWNAIEKISSMLTNEEHLKKARIHPINILAALITYQSGHGMRGSGEWRVTPQIVDALNEAFYKAFQYVEPTGKRYLIGVDVSGSMGGGSVSGIPGLTPATAAATLAMAVARIEKHYHIMGFADEFRDLGITARSSLKDAMDRSRAMNFGRTDCALPMMWAMDHSVEADMFVILTDNETWVGGIHPAQALKKYRQVMGINAKLAVLAMTPSSFSIADPNDSGMLDLAGFGSDTPAVLSAFAKL